MICRDCKHSTEIRGKRHCKKIEGRPLCINAREEWWPKKEKKRECGTGGDYFESK